MADAEKILKKFHDIAEKMSEEREQDRDERVQIKERIGKVEEDTKQAFEEMKAWRAEHVASDAPLDDIQALYVNQKGGVFNGKFRMPYKKMLSLPTNQPVLNAAEKERLSTIQRLHDAAVLRYWAYAKQQKPGQDSKQLMERMLKDADFNLYLDHLVKAGYAKAAGDLLDPSQATGSSLDFTLLSAQLIDLVRVNAVLAAQFPRVTLLRKSQEFPALRGDCKAVLGGGTGVALPQDDFSAAPWTGSAPPSAAVTKPTFAQVAFSAEHCLGFIPYTDDMLEDSIVPLLPLLYDQAQRMINNAQEDAIVNGDDTATHMDDDYATPMFAAAWDGLRKLGENNTYDPGTDKEIEVAQGNAMMQKMGKWAQRPGELVWCMNVIEWLKLAADSNLMTIDKWGNEATLRQGVVNRLWGVDIVLSAEVRRDLSDTGYKGTTGPFGHTVHIIFNRTRFWLAEKNQLDIESVRVPAALGNWIQADLRCDFQAIDKDKGDNVFAAGAAPVCIAIDITA